MISEYGLKKKLERLKNKEPNLPFLSIYLSFDEIKSPSNNRLKTELHSLLTQNLTEEEHKLFRGAIKKMEKYLDEEYDSRGKRSLAFFAKDGLLETVEFEFSLPVLCRVSRDALLRPIQSAMQDHNKYLVVMADRKKARFFTVRLGEIEENGELMVDMVPQNVKANEEKYFGREDKIFRHIEDHLARHLKIVVRNIEEFARGKGINFIILGGHEELFEKIKKHMPKHLKDKIRGEFISELNIPLNDIFLESKKVVENIQEKQKYKRMHESILQAGSYS